MIKLFEKKAECCGCAACYSICPNEAITITKDLEGFDYPYIDKKKCNECGLCKKVCPIKKGVCLD